MSSVMFQFKFSRIRIRQKAMPASISEIENARFATLLLKSHTVLWLFEKQFLEKAMKQYFRRKNFSEKNISTRLCDKKCVPQGGTAKSKALKTITEASPFSCFLSLTASQTFYARLLVKAISKLRMKPKWHNWLPLYCDFYTISSTNIFLLLSSSSLSISFKIWWRKKKVSCLCVYLIDSSNRIQTS